MRVRYLYRHSSRTPEGVHGMFLTRCDKGLEPQGLAGPHQPLARGERAEKPRPDRLTPSGRSGFFGDIRRFPNHCQNILHKLCSLQSGKDIGLTNDHLLIIRDADGKPFGTFAARRELGLFN